MSCTPSTSSISSASARNEHRAYTEPEPEHIPLESAIMQPVHHVTIVSQPTVVKPAPSWQLNTSISTQNAGSSAPRSGSGPGSPSGFGLSPLYDSPTATPIQPRVSARIARRNSLLSRPPTSAYSAESTSPSGLTRVGSLSRHLPPPMETEAEHDSTGPAGAEAHPASEDVGDVHAPFSTVA
ncbi:hypothetical protein C8Q79DRAFT_1011100 [Trametes meyenii]|nr:hypothetical protein C8Q79DRAFT_1011100 [Trametes meyenii]